MVYTYDGTYEGLLSAIFETYRLKTPATRIVPQDEWQDSLFEQPLYVDTNPAWAKRVLQGVERQGSKATSKILYRAFLSEQPQVSDLIYDFIKKAMLSKIDITDNFADDTVLRLHKLDKQMGREIHRMHAFIRFQRTRDDIYYSVIEPDFNVMPLIGEHFEKRYPAQHWLIYDAKRRYGLSYNHETRQTDYITFADDHRLQLRQLNEDILDGSEPDYQILWKSYFDSVNIPERKNVKLHLQHVPRRYWKYLSEKREQF